MGPDPTLTEETIGALEPKWAQSGMAGEFLRGPANEGMKQLLGQVMQAGPDRAQALATYFKAAKAYGGVKYMELVAPPKEEF